MKRFKFTAKMSSKFFAGFLVALPVFFLFRTVSLGPISGFNGRGSGATRLSSSEERGVQYATQLTADPEISVPQFPSSKNRSSRFTNTRIPKDKLLGGLISPGFDENSCLSRYKSNLYRKTSPHKPSAFLISKLRNYENLHKHCGPNTESYNKALKQLISGNVSSSGECKYIVWIAYSGLGNRILSMTSAFLYALLTNRVLLIDQKPEMADLFCEPFPNSSWLLPMDFPSRDQFNDFDQHFAQSYGNMLKYDGIDTSSEELSVSYVYLHLAHDSDNHDNLFFCDNDQIFLRKIPWLFLKTDNYFVPALFRIPFFREVLSQLFPNKETVFHHLGRYLFHPTNEVWGLITRYYQAYLAKANEKIGIQIRVFNTLTTPSQLVMDQILSCTLNENLLPEVDRLKILPAEDQAKNRVSKAVLITSLYSKYFENMKDMYRKHPTVTGEVIGIYQPSHEEHQKTEDNLHNMKAWAEMNLLSMCDVLITSAWSTFGYVAQGLAGIRPWVLYRIENRKAPDTACGQVMSMEPCFHSPPIHKCKAKTLYEDNSAILPYYIRHCEDVRRGLKLFNQ
ncbi:Galactoside 2-alpha-L-fucosyltransferase [Melia azedarach]|uniref:Galactoside 2-alpha-L-fucosyltransferase n=1 Tax=Melia azedarach TaxID=155640 RepID=A0ACC1YB93_MELAZ|nr:Galactoside 2-alpha-L-fucosyltransferase [Melia azedarach]